MSLSPLSSSGVRSLSLALLTLDPVTPTPVAAPVEPAPAATSVTIKKPQPFLDRDVFQIAELVASCTPLGDSRTSFDQPLAKIVAEYVGCSQSFSERVKLRLTEHLFSSTPLNEDVARLVAEYVKGDENAFGAKEWQEYYGVDVGPELPFSKDLIDWWLDTDPLEPSKSIYDTHLPPVLRPQSISIIETNTQKAFSLKSLGQIVATPAKGHAGHYVDRSPALIDYENTPAGPACVLVMRKGVLFREDAFPYGEEAYHYHKKALQALNGKIKKDVGYVSETSALDLATIVFTRYTVTGERHLSDGSGVENLPPEHMGPRFINGVCRERSRFPFQLDGEHRFRVCRVCVGGFDSSGGLRVHSLHRDASNSIGIMAMRKFTVAS